MIAQAITSELSNQMPELSKRRSHAMRLNGANAGLLFNLRTEKQTTKSIWQWDETKSVMETFKKLFRSANCDISPLYTKSG